MHAVLITAYKDFPTLLRMVSRLDPSFFRIFIHIDKRSAIGSKEVEQLETLGCHCIRHYRIRWGAVTHLYAILDLLKLAVRSGNYDYVHIVTGQDYPIASVEAFKRKCDGRIFLNYEPLEASPDYVSERYDRYNVFHALQGGLPFSGTIHKNLDRISTWLQRKLSIHRRMVAPYTQLFKGIVWMSFPQAAARKIVEDRDALTFLNAAKTTYLAEEIYFQTYFLNSELKGLVVNDDLRFTDWTHRNDSVPAYLDESDVDAALASGALFARKVSSEVSQAFMRRIDEALSGAQPS